MTSFLNVEINNVHIAIGSYEDLQRLFPPSEYLYFALKKEENKWIPLNFGEVARYLTSYPNPRINVTLKEEWTRTQAQMSKLCQDITTAGADLKKRSEELGAEFDRKIDDYRLQQNEEIKGQNEAIKKQNEEIKKVKENEEVSAQLQDIKKLLLEVKKQMEELKTFPPQVGEQHTGRKKKETGRSQQQKEDKTSLTLFVKKTPQNTTGLQRCVNWFKDLMGQVQITEVVPQDAVFVIVPYTLTTPRNVSTASVEQEMKQCPGQIKFALFLQYGENEQNTPKPEFGFRKDGGFQDLFVLFSEKGIVDCDRSREARSKLLVYFQDNSKNKSTSWW